MMTADDVLSSPEPILSTAQRIDQECQHHGLSADEYERDMATTGRDPLDFRNLLNWLGY